MQSDKYIVYKHTSPSGKVYIGITRQKPNRRFKGGNGYSANSHFYSAIQKYGWDAFRHEVLFEYLSADDAGELEKILIRRHRSTDPERGYNQEPGGLVPDNLSELATQRNYRRLENPDFYRRQVELAMEMTRKKMEPVICLDTGEEYESVRAAALACGVDFRNLMKVLQGKRSHTCGLHFAFKGENNGPF